MCQVVSVPCYARMNGPRAFCPNCKKDVLFINDRETSRCSVCGAEFELSQPPPLESHGVGSTVMTIGHVILRVILILGVLFLVGIAVLFASCALR
jgi:uncharacterized protein (DUF983 family)